jgi:hypothetical protein
MAYYIATIDILVDVDGGAEAADCIAEAMRDLCRVYTAGSDVIDWRYSTRAAVNPTPMIHDGGGFEFVPPTKEN